MPQHNSNKTPRFPVKSPSIYRKHLGYFCLKCQERRRLDILRLCPCLDFVEDAKAIKVHINAWWVPIYADVNVSQSHITQLQELAR